MIHQDPWAVLPFSVICLLVCFVFSFSLLCFFFFSVFQGFLVFGVYISKLPSVSLTTSRSHSEMRFSVNNAAPGASSARPRLSQRNEVDERFSLVHISTVLEAMGR